MGPRICTLTLTPTVTWSLPDSVGVKLIGAKLHQSGCWNDAADRGRVREQNSFAVYLSQHHADDRWIHGTLTRFWPWGYDFW